MSISCALLDRHFLLFGLAVDYARRKSYISGAAPRSTGTTIRTVTFKRYYDLNTYFRSLFGGRVHKITMDAGFTCPNRDGSKGRGGCSFCNNVSFSPNGRTPPPISQQLAAGRRVICKRTGAGKYLAYFQAYTEEFGAELWSSDGTVAGTGMVADIATGYNQSSSPENLVPVGSQLFFIASEDATYNYDLWVYDGAEARKKAAAAEVKEEGKVEMVHYLYLVVLALVLQIVRRYPDAHCLREWSRADRV